MEQILTIKILELLIKERFKIKNPCTFLCLEIMFSISFSLLVKIKIKHKIFGNNLNIMVCLSGDLLTLIVFHIIVALLVLIDLFVGSKRRHAMSLKESITWSIIWIGFGILFGILLLYKYSISDIAEYFTVFMLEKSLSVDNLFMFAFIFSYFKAPVIARPLLLYAGILCAIVMRAAFIYFGIAVLEALPWVVFIFAFVLFYSAVKTWKSSKEVTNLKKNFIVKFAKHYLPIADRYKGKKFIISKKPLLFSPLVLVVITIELVDIMFAIDSIPAALAISKNFVIVYTANIAAVLGLRSLYFLIDYMVLRFKYLNKGLTFVLILLGTKFMLKGFHIDFPKEIAIIATLSIIGVSVLLSVISDRKKQPLK